MVSMESKLWLLPISTNLARKWRQCAVFALWQTQVPFHLLVEETSHWEEVRHTLYIRPQVLASQCGHQSKRCYGGVQTVCRTWRSETGDGTSRTILIAYPTIRYQLPVLTAGTSSEGSTTNGIFAWWLSTDNVKSHTMVMWQCVAVAPDCKYYNGTSLAIKLSYLSTSSHPLNDAVWHMAIEYITLHITLHMSTKKVSNKNC